MVLAEVRAGLTLAEILKKILPLILLFIFFMIVVLYLYSAVGNAVHEQHKQAIHKEEEAVQALEVLQNKTANITKYGGVQLYNFQLKELQSYIIYNVKFEYVLYDPKLDESIVNVYCNDKLYDVWTIQNYGSHTSVSYNLKCPDWSGMVFMHVSIEPEKFLIQKQVYGGTGEVKTVTITTYILDFQVKSLVISVNGTNVNNVTAQFKG